MQVEILKFLLDARGHLESSHREADTQRLDDLQAVESAHSDCDWFELGERREPVPGGANQLWAEHGVGLGF